MFGLGIGFFAGIRYRSQGKQVENAGNNESCRYSFGKVVSVSDRQLAVCEYDFSKDCDAEVVYNVIPDTEFGNVQPLTDLKPDDDVVIDYVEKEGRRVIMIVVREQVLMKDESEEYTGSSINGINAEQTP